MKRNILHIIMSVCLLAACTVEPRPHLDEDRVTDVKIIVTPCEVQNTYLLQSNRTDIICFWDLGNGTTASGVNEVVASYPFAGTYSVTMTSYAANGRANDVSVKIRVTTENLYLLDDPMYEYVAGKIGGEGKTWMLDNARQDHIALFNPNNVADKWWGAGPDAKDGCEIYDDKATFILNVEKGQAFEYVNNGKSSALNNETAAMSLVNDAAWNATSYNKATTNDYIISCTPPQKMGWSLSQSSGSYYISFPSTSSGHGGYLFYFCGWDTQYEIRAISETHMKIFMWSTINGSKSLRQIILRTEDTPSGNEPIEWIWSKD
ncbi:MAG: PKD domain-containing protein [Candidatus Cryptobacteroides sp.]